MSRPSATLLVLLFLLGAAHAQDLKAVRPLPGYVCMALALTPEQTADPTRGVPVRDIPSLSAPVASWAPSMLVVVVPQQPTAGFLQVVFADGHKGWLQAAALKPWNSPTNPSRRCVPSVMSDGGIGFGFQG